MTVVDIGLHPNLTDTEYHSLFFASQSRLRAMRRSPGHMQWALAHPKPQTPAQRLGSAVHDCVLLPDVFEDRYVLASQCHAETKAGKQCSNMGLNRYDGAWACGIAAHQPPGALLDPVTTLAPEDWATCIGIRDSISRHPAARALLDVPPEHLELSAVWRDEESGVTCCGRFDALYNDRSIVTDLKTTPDASPDAFTRTIYTYGYYIQGAHYTRGAVALGCPAECFAIVAAEKEPPFAVAVYEVRHEALDAGIKELRPLLELWAKCEREARWPMYPDGVTQITLPPWAWSKVDERATTAALATEEGEAADEQ